MINTEFMRIRIKSLADLEKRICRFGEILVGDLADEGPITGIWGTFPGEDKEIIIKEFKCYGQVINDLLEKIEQTQPLTLYERGEVKKYYPISKLLLQSSGEIRNLSGEQAYQEKENTLNQLTEKIDELTPHDKLSRTYLNRTREDRTKSRISRTSIFFS